MSGFSASASKGGSARLPIDRSHTVTSTASATATSVVSQSDAQTTADTIAQQVANSVAGNDANIISQALELSPAGIIKAHNIDDFIVSYNFGPGTTRYSGTVSPDASNPENLAFYGGFSLQPSATPALGAATAATLLSGRGSIYTTFAPIPSLTTPYYYDVLVSIVNNIDVGQFKGALLDGVKHSMAYCYTIRGTYSSPTKLKDLAEAEIEDIVYSIINDTAGDSWEPAKVLTNDLSLRSNSCQLLDKGAAVSGTQVTNAQIGADAKKTAVLGGVLEYTLGVQYEDAFTSKRFARAHTAFKAATAASTLGVTVAGFL